MGGECKHPEIHEKGSQNGGFRFVPSSYLHNKQQIFLLFKSTHLRLILKKVCINYGVSYAAVFEIFYAKVGQVTMYYIGPGNC